jgi:hypothetical protein
MKRPGPRALARFTAYRACLAAHETWPRIEVPGLWTPRTREDARRLYPSLVEAGRIAALRGDGFTAGRAATAAGYLRQWIEAAS